MRCAPITWIGLDWIGLDWIGLDWIGLDWIGLDWIGLTKNQLVAAVTTFLYQSPCQRFFCLAVLPKFSRTQQ